LPHLPWFTHRRAGARLPPLFRLCTRRGQPRTADSIRRVRRLSTHRSATDRKICATHHTVGTRVLTRPQYDRPCNTVQCTRRRGAPVWSPVSRPTATLTARRKRRALRRRAAGCRPYVSRTQPSPRVEGSCCAHITARALCKFYVNLLRFPNLCATING